MTMNTKNPETTTLDRIRVAQDELKAAVIYLEVLLEDLENTPDPTKPNLVTGGKCEKTEVFQSFQEIYKDIPNILSRRAEIIREVTDRLRALLLL